MNPRLSILGDVGAIPDCNRDEIKLILLMMTAAKKCLLVNWKSNDAPSIKQWWRELLTYCTPERIMYSVRGQLEEFNRIWGKLINSIENIENNLGSC